MAIGKPNPKSGIRNWGLRIWDWGIIADFGAQIA
jgi:hypothetical protein